MSSQKTLDQIKSYEDEDYDEWKNSDYANDRENWSPTGKEANLALYPVLTYLPEGNP